VVPPNQIIQVLALPDANRFLIGFVCVERGQRCCVGATFIDRDHFRRTVMANSLQKKRRAAAASRLAVSRKSMVWPAVSAARYRYFHWPVILR